MLRFCSENFESFFAKTQWNGDKFRWLLGITWATAWANYYNATRQSFQVCAGVSKRWPGFLNGSTWKSCQTNLNSCKKIRSRQKNTDHQPSDLLKEKKHFNVTHLFLVHLISFNDIRSLNAINIPNLNNRDPTQCHSQICRSKSYFL